MGPLINIRLDRIGQSIQPIFDLAGLLPDGVQGRWITRRIGSMGTAKGILMAEVVVSSAAYLSHGCGNRGGCFCSGGVESQESRTPLRKQMPKTKCMVVQRPVFWSIYLEEKIGKEGEKLKMLSYVTRDLF